MLDKLKMFISGRRQAYVDVFRGPQGDKVLADLVRFCRGTKSTFHPDARVHALLEGRREVLQRIADHLKLSPEQLYEVYQQGKNPGE